jgi:phosphohistidine phosphatase SixA
MPTMRHRALHALAVLWLLLLGSAAQANEAVWDRLRGGGLVIMIRHANAPGTGDPPGFRAEDCATQRNLSAEGRAQAAALGAEFRNRKVPVGRVLSSRWCRAIDTARFAFGGSEIEPALDSLFGRRDQAEEQNARTRTLMRAWTSTDSNLVLVTHNANIAALTGLSTADAEAVVVRAVDDRLEIIGRIRP